jgi:UDP-3-O-[3-hydroxymyristoyl] glucosamine N-acyltransferase
MTDLVFVGSSRFAVDVAGIVDASLRAAGVEVAQRVHLALAGEEAATDPALTVPFHADALRAGGVVVAVADPEARSRLFAEHLEALRQAAINVVHPSAVVATGCRMGAGNIVGPYCYIGANSALGDLNILNYHVGIGHHSHFGSCNFAAPGFQCGNSVGVGDHNFFGLSCAVGPRLTIGDRNRFQAGSTITQPVASGLVCYGSERLKAIKLSGDQDAAR